MLKYHIAKKARHTHKEKSKSTVTIEVKTIDNSMVF
jgi:hypothetical protein